LIAFPRGLRATTRTRARRGARTRGRLGDHRPPAGAGPVAAGSPAGALVPV